ncbi:DUF6708 domain-containing protein [Burkholderia pseudomallei]|uniref:DUF6708 domain-containing protein n=1 Tax=Burkholderia pseudomallei TaxID=28450 RepID=UPI0030017473
MTDTELLARLQQKERCAEKATSSGTIFKATGSYLEVCDGLYREKGWGVLAFSTAGTAALCLIAMTAWMATHVPAAIEQKGQASLAHWVLGVFLLVEAGVFILPLRSLLNDCFNYTRKPIRFNRVDRKIYAFRHNGPGGVISVPWDDAFLYVERQPKAGLTSTAPRMVRCLVLDEQGRVSDSFRIGKRVVLASSEEGEVGKRVMAELYEDFEYYRRFMEDGPASVPPVTEFLSTKVSFRNSLKLQFDGMSDMFRSGNVFLQFMGLIGAIPTFLLAVAYHLAQLTCREPVWPDDVERACMSSPKQPEGVAS